EDAAVRLERLTKQVAEAMGSWSMGPVVAAYQAMRGVALITAVTAIPREMAAFLWAMGHEIAPTTPA
ncbi:MAG: hypothetical protein ACOYLK_05905, partial [Sphingomonas sp.]